MSKEPVARGKGPDDFSPSRGRELPVIGDNLTHSGKGGAGNVRSPSRDAEGNRKAAREAGEHAKASYDPDAPISSGRGGYGNIDRSRSRSKDPNGSSTNPTPRTSTQVHTYGHGGAGNVAPNSGSSEGQLKAVEENEAKAYGHHTEVHSSGRGGAGNIKHGDAPGRKAESEEMKAHHHGEGHESAGRGGAGNIH